jgi:hypothetical protein
MSANGYMERGRSTFDAAEEITRVTCLVCGGGYYDSYIAVIKPPECVWCTVGTMTPEQVTTWKARPRT